MIARARRDGIFEAIIFQNEKFQCQLEKCLDQCELFGARVCATRQHGHVPGERCRVTSVCLPPSPSRETGTARCTERQRRAHLVFAWSARRAALCTERPETAQYALAVHYSSWSLASITVMMMYSRNLPAWHYVCSSAPPGLPVIFIVLNF